VRELNSFSYLEYSHLIRNVADSGRHMDFREVNRETPSFIVLRHDVEFSIDRAMRMAQLEWMLGINSSYFFQMRNDAYNLFSPRNIGIVRAMKQMGHSIGLHAHLGMLENYDELANDLVRDIEIMERMLKLPIDRYSYHRPSKAVLSLKIKIDGLINAYDDLFFEHRDGDLEKVSIKYLADSRHQWRYGYPEKQTIANHPKIQLLIHPDEWTIAGYDTGTNFRTLEDEQTIRFRQTIRSECDHYTQA
jgi:hypothetical protein